MVGWALYRTVVFRLVDRDLFVSLLATFGLSIVLQQVMNQVFGADLRNANAELDSTFLLGDSVVLGNAKLVAFAVAPHRGRVAGAVPAPQPGPGVRSGRRPRTRARRVWWGCAPIASTRWPSP